MKVIVVGAGVMGMMQARALAMEGVEVLLLERGHCGAQSSWAGGGIVSPLYPWRYSPAVTALATWSQSQYEHICNDLKQDGGIDPEMTRHGLLMLSVEDEGCARSWSQRSASWLESVDAEEIYRLEPMLVSGFERSLWMPQVASIRPPRLVQALRHFLEAHPKVMIHEQSPVTGFTEAASSITLETPQGHFEADRVVLASGAWTSGLLPNSPISIQPVKGQMILFEAKPGLVNRVILRDGRYLIPRRDGRILVGSTLEYTGFEKSLDNEAKQSLAEFAKELVPALSKLEPAHHWAGLRPGSPEGVPYIGQVPESRHLFVNAGHFRNGLVLAPCSVQLMTDLLLARPPVVDPQPYDPASPRTPLGETA